MFFLLSKIRVGMDLKNKIFLQKNYDVSLKTKTKECLSNTIGRSGIQVLVQCNI